MIHSTKKIILAALVVLMGWVLAWPFRRSPEIAENLSPLKNQQAVPLGIDKLRKTKVPPKATDSLKPKLAANSLGTLPSLPPTRIPRNRSRVLPELPAREPLISLPSTESRHTKELQTTLTGGLAQSQPTAGLSDPFKNTPSLFPPQVRQNGPKATNIATHLPSQYEPNYPFTRKSTPQSSHSHVTEENARPAYETITNHMANSEEVASNWPREILHEIQRNDTLEKLAKRYLGNPNRALDIFNVNRDKLKNPELLPIGEELRIPARWNSY